MYTLDEAYDVSNVFCYDVGFHPVVGIALLSSFLNIGTPLLFAFVTRFHVLFGKKIFKMSSKVKRGELQIKKFKKKFVMMMLLYALSLLIQFAISITLLVLLSVNYLTPSVNQNSFQIFLSNEAYYGQGIALFCLHLYYLLLIHVLLLNIIIYKR